MSRLFLNKHIIKDCLYFLYFIFYYILFCFVLFYFYFIFILFLFYFYFILYYVILCYFICYCYCGEHNTLTVQKWIVESYVLIFWKCYRMFIVRFLFHIHLFYFTIYLPFLDTTFESKLLRRDDFENPCILVFLVFRTDIRDWIFHFFSAKMYKSKVSLFQNI